MVPPRPQLRTLSKADGYLPFSVEFTSASSTPRTRTCAEVRPVFLPLQISTAWPRHHWVLLTEGDCVWAWAVGLGCRLNTCKRRWTLFLQPRKCSVGTDRARPVSSRHIKLSPLPAPSPWQWRERHKSCRQAGRLEGGTQSRGQFCQWSGAEKRGVW